MQLIAPLFEGPLDVVGDVHGEIDALNALLKRLGYAEDGSHAEDRRLVFVGDLTDRGPDSPAVLRKVMALVESGRAQCIVGNHELALLCDERKHENGWWFDSDWPDEHPQQPVDPAEKSLMREFMACLPVVLERDDLRVVHASWNDKAIARLRESAATSVAKLYQQSNADFEVRWSQGALKESLDAEENILKQHEWDITWTPRYFGTKARYEREKQMNNPVAISTSGEETETDKPFFAGGRWRMVERVAWWDNYRDPIPVIVGHYWRNVSDVLPEVFRKKGSDLFEGIAPHHWMGAEGNVYCVDFSVGGRAEQRAAGKPLEHCSLAAVRVGEWEVVHDGGDGAVMIRP